LDAAIGELDEAAAHNDRSGIVQALQELIPEYRPPQLAAANGAAAEPVTGPTAGERAATVEGLEWPSFAAKTSSSTV
jgi:hypothetical protein